MKAAYTTTVGAVVAATGGKLARGDAGAAIATVTTDSRELGDANLFIALVGEKFDGHRFIEPLCAEKKISAFLSMKPEYAGCGAGHGVAAIICDDTLRALGSLAARHREGLPVRVIGITGTNGKTTTKELAHAVLSSTFRTLKNEKNYNNEIGVPFTLLGLSPEHELAVIEMGMNHPGEIDRLSRMARPEIALITNVGAGHLEFLGTVENVARAKAEIMSGMRPGSTVIINRDTECFDLLAARARECGLVTRTYGLSDAADVRPESYAIDANRSSLVWRGAEFRVPVYGIHNIYNMLAALALAETFGIANDRIAASLRDFANVGGRSGIIEGEYTVIDDTYNANPLSTSFALKSASRLFPGRRKIAVLADMKELGEAAPRYHAQTGSEVAAEGFDLFFAWGEMAGHYAEGARRAGMNGERVQVCPDKRELCDRLAAVVRKGDVVLVKGSRSMKMEEVVQVLRK